MTVAVEDPGQAERVFAKILELGSQIGQKIATHPVPLTWEAAFEHPALQGLDTSLVAILGAADTVTAMQLVVERYNNKWEELAEQDSDKLDPAARVALLDKLDAVARVARGLSYVAKRRAATPGQLFVFTMRQLIPWITQAVKLGVLLVGAVV